MSPHHSPSALPDILWHGTTLRAARQIAATGMLGTTYLGKPSQTTICLSPDRATATFFAMSKARPAHTHPEDAPVLIAVPRSALAPRRLRRDVTLTYSPFGPLPRLHVCKDMDLGPYIADLRRSKRNWRQSLDQVNGIIHAGPIALPELICDTSVADVPFPSSRAEEKDLELKAIFPQGWQMPPPALQAITDPSWDVGAQTPTPLSSLVGMRPHILGQIHARLGQAFCVPNDRIKRTRHSWICEGAVLYDAQATALDDEAIEGMCTRVFCGPQTPLFLLPEQGHEPARRAVLPSLVQIRRPRGQTPHLTLLMDLRVAWIHPSRLGAAPHTPAHSAPASLHKAA